MPYMMEGNCVHKKNPDGSLGEMVKCHATEADAKKHMAALEANVPDAKKDVEGEKMLLFRQPEVQYVTLSATAGKACANCRWFKSSVGYDGEDQCHLVDNWPDPILPTGYCDRHEAKADMMPLQPAPIPVVIVEADEAGMAMEKALKPKGMYPLAKVKALLNTVIELFTPARNTPLFSVQSGFKDLDNGHWLAWWTNNFEDKEGELFTEKAIDDYIARVDGGEVPMPELWFWHMNFTKHGQAKQLARLGHFALAVGDYDDTPAAKSFRRYYQKNQNELGVSHGYYYPEWALQDGAYHVFNTFEISPLPSKSKAANSHASFMEVKEMELTQEKRAALVGILGEDGLKTLLAAAESQGKDKEAAGEKYKSIPTPPDNPVLVDKIKTLETAQASFATKDDVKALATSIDGLKDFLKAAFGDAKPASGDKSTEIKPDDVAHPYHALMASWLQEQGEKGAAKQQKSILDYMLDVHQGGG